MENGGGLRNLRYYRDRAVTIRIAQNPYLDYINLRQ